jgi:ABC-type multidrug transport system fused ATPase/permease subunit
MDDILSAVDAHTAQFIFKECLQGSLLRGRTVVMVTHHVGLCLPGADFVVALRDGKVEEACAANESHVDTTIEPPQEEELLSPPPTATAKRLEGEPQARQTEDQPSPRRIYQAEKTSEGRVNTSHFMMVFSAAGGAFYWTVLALIFGSTTSFDLARNIFLRHWSTDPSPAHLDKNLLIYLSIVTGAILMGALRWVWLYGVGPVGFYNRGSRKIHATLLDRICGAPLSFFESTPMGRLMNIFGQDVRRLDAYVADDFGREWLRV